MKQMTGQQHHKNKTCFIIFGAVFKHYASAPPQPPSSSSPSSSSSSSKEPLPVTHSTAPVSGHRPHAPPSSSVHRRAGSLFSAFEPLSTTDGKPCVPSISVCAAQRVVPGAFLRTRTPSSWSWWSSSSSSPSSSCGRPARGVSPASPVRKLNKYATLLIQCFCVSFVATRRQGEVWRETMWCNTRGWWRFKSTLHSF